MTYQNRILQRALPGALALLAAVTLLSFTIACRGGADTAATATPAFSLPTALPSPEAVPAGGGAEATAARTSAYWDGPTSWEPEDVSGLERVTQELAPPPFLPEHEQTYDGEPRVVEVRMTVGRKGNRGCARSVHLGLYLQRLRSRPHHSGARGGLRVS